MKITLIVIKSSDYVWYLDTDIIILSPLTIAGKISDTCLSKAYINKKLIDGTGMFNAGYLWTKSKEFVPE